MEGHQPPHLHSHQHQQPLHHHHQRQQLSVNVDLSPSSGADRFPQWSVQETKEFLLIRAELDQAFMETKRNKLLWGVISTKMKDKGYHRSSEQCKCKWKNLVTRYKGCESIEAEAMRQQFPFFNDMQAIFGARIQRMLWAEAEGGTSSSSRKKPTTAVLYSEDEEEEEDSEDERGKKKKKAKISVAGGNTGGSGASGEVRRLLDDFMKQQMEMEMQWREAFEARENERRAKEMEWRQKMEALENERIMMDRRWREREEQRRVRDEARAEKRDALITTLLNKLRKSEQDRM
ncbi:hypothetical protein MLD38_029757 [Melastoma candidum]|uniref:Uncharacterized protein n=1 Tax=Melastoma candidum TaxID=119954 RepID=A0ACB9NAA4_9MYRT|nr:hypothetical protein MLD38_029757 [Melastoma candidum]